MPSDEEYQHMEAHNLMQESVAHGVHAWIENLDRDGINELGMLMHATLGNPAYGWEVIGILKGELRRKYNACYVCNKDHEAEERELLTRKDETPAPIPDTPFHVGDAEAFDDELAKEMIGRPFPEYVALCQKYNVTNNIDQLAQVFCRGCNIRYPNLDDRMLKEPDDCSGCHEMAKTGHKFPPPSQQ